MPETWPAKLGYPDYNDHGFSNDSPLERTAFESGRIRQRLIATTENKLIPVTLKVDDEQLGAVQSWLRYKVDFGNTFFNMPLELGNGEQTYSVRVVSNNYGAKHEDGLYRFNMILEVLNPTIMSEAALDTWLS